MAAYNRIHEKTGHWPTIIMPEFRLGGRIWTHYIDCPEGDVQAIDMGAAFIHGKGDQTKVNPIYQIAMDKDIIVNPVDYESFKAFNWKGEVIDMDKIEPMYFDLLDFVKNEKEIAPAGTSLGDTIEKYITAKSLSTNQIRDLYF